MTIEDANGGDPLRGEPVGAPTGAGWWPSPWSAAQVAAGKVSRGGLQSDGGSVYWCEGRPAEGGRQVVVGIDPDAGQGSGPVDVTPPGVSVRSRVHEYGGGSATVVAGTVFYVDQDDQSWYRLDRAAGPVPVRLGAGAGPDAPRPRHGDGRLTVDGRWLVSVEERVGATSTTHRLVAVPTDGSGPSTVLVDAGDFVSSPRPSPDGRWLAWITWDHPDMPWDASRLLVAPLDTSDRGVAVGAPIVVAGGTGVSVGQPRWCRDGALVFVDDRSGWWLPYRVAPGAPDRHRPVDAVALVQVDAEFLFPDWVLGQHTFDELDDGSLVARMGARGRDRLVVLRPPPSGPDATGWSVEEVDQPCRRISAVTSPDGRRAVVLGSTSTEAQVVLVVDLVGGAPPRRLSAAPGVAVAPERVARATARVAATGAHGVPGLFFAPQAVSGVGDTGGPPPLVVFCHGGPTASADPGYDPVVQFFASRGIAVAVVDYRGSTGYGRAYRQLLQGRWGEADVDDCVTYAESLAADGLVDGRRMAIRGTSAGGLTALAALVRARCFAGAVAWYGVTDLLSLATDTHDFESRYLDGLVGRLPDAADAYRDRSPVHHAGEMGGKVLLLQGSDDPIVPLGQAQGFAAALGAAGADCRLVVFEGESHGFRRSDTIEAALTAELGFYRELFAGEGVGGR
ncbi:MAG: prolyl oligopeptidase family serine peptidase [Acidimicrobiales bacterium]|jgi:dipeptidyl aminopeptidase/acylaminoacyl peptidase